MTESTYAPQLTESQIFQVSPCERLEGEVTISGAKNSVLKIMAATTLAAGRSVISNVPRISDVCDMAELLTSIGCDVSWTAPHQLTIDVPDQLTPVAPYHLVARLRASIALLGPLLGRCGEVEVALPGGDDLGPRPVDMHLKALEDMGAEIDFQHGVISARASNLVGCELVLDFPSVGATENIMMAAVNAKGATVIDNAAREPEISDLADCLTQMGASVTGAGTSTITINCAADPELLPVRRDIIADRIEASTFLSAVAVAGGEVLLRGARPDHLDMVVRKFTEMGMTITATDDGLVAASNRQLQAVDVATLPYPGVPTDTKPLMAVVLAYSDGVGILTENLFAGRFKYIDELARMGADIRSESQHVIVRGKPQLSGAPVQGHDIRGAAALVVAGLGAQGITQVHGAAHIDRGYEDLHGKLAGLGVEVERK